MNLDLCAVYSRIMICVSSRVKPILGYACSLYPVFHPQWINWSVLNERAATSGSLDGLVDRKGRHTGKARTRPGARGRTKRAQSATDLRPVRALVDYTSSAKTGLSHGLVSVLDISLT